MDGTVAMRRLLCLKYTAVIDKYSTVFIFDRRVWRNGTGERGDGGGNERCVDEMTPVVIKEIRADDPDLAPFMGPDRGKVSFGFLVTITVVDDQGPNASVLRSVFEPTKTRHACKRTKSLSWETKVPLFFSSPLLPDSLTSLLRQLPRSLLFDSHLISPNLQTHFSPRLHASLLRAFDSTTPFRVHGHVLAWNRTDSPP